jgi:hypothetical protein
MRRLLVVSALVALPLLPTFGVGSGQASLVHADSGKVNWSQQCSSGANLGGATHGACVSRFAAIQTWTMYCREVASHFGSWNFVLTFYSDPGATQQIAGPFSVRNPGSCASTFARLKGLNWGSVMATTP